MWENIWNIQKPEHAQFIHTVIYLGLQSKWLNNLKQQDSFMLMDTKSDANYDTLNVNIINLVNSFTAKGRVKASKLFRDSFNSRW